MNTDNLSLASLRVIAAKKGLSIQVERFGRVGRRNTEYLIVGGDNRLLADDYRCSSKFELANKLNQY